MVILDVSGNRAAANWLDVGVVWFDEGDLRRQAGDTWYALGLDYVDQVDDMRWSPGAVMAAVYGSEACHVRLSNNRGLLNGSCSCPSGQQGNFCEHSVAVGLAALEAAPSQPCAREPGRDAVALRASLDGLEKAALVDLLVELAEGDRAVHRLLSLRSRPDEFDPGRLYAMVDALKRTGHQEDDDVALAALCRSAGQALRTLDMFATNHPAAIRPLYQRVMQHLTALSFDGQPDGHLTVIRDAVTCAMNGIVATARAAPPDPIEFARWLLDVQIQNSRFPDLTIGHFAETLGDEGLGSYRRELSERHDAASADEDDGAWRRRRTIFQLRASYMIDIDEDIDGLADLCAEGLTEPERYVLIGKALRAAERFDDAIAWLRRGLAEASWGRSDICDLLVAVYTQTGRLKEAARTRLEDFGHRPTEYGYHMLLCAAEAIDAVPYAQQQAMALLRERAARGGKNAADPLVRILIAIDEIDQAWAAAQEFGCSDECMFALALYRARHHPADAIPIYAREVEAAIACKDRSGYAKAARLLVSLRDLHQRAGTDFGTYLDHIKFTHRRKSTLMECLAEARL